MRSKSLVCFPWLSPPGIGRRIMMKQRGRRLALLLSRDVCLLAGTSVSHKFLFLADPELFNAVVERRAKVGMVGILTGLKLPVLVKSVSVSSYNGQYMTNKPIHISDDFWAHYVTQTILLVIFCLEAGLYVSST